MALSWEQIISNQESDTVALPPPDRQIVDKNHFIEVSYTYDKESDTIERIERKGKIVRKNKRISKEAQRRSKTMNKFGKVANKEKGFIEKGITEVRLEEFGIIWEGLSKQERDKDRRQKKNVGKNLKPIRDDIKDDKSPKPVAKPKFSDKIKQYREAGKYAPLEDEMYEIRISNLPDATLRDDIHHMMKGLFEKMYYSLSIAERRKQKLQEPPKRFKIGCFVTRRDQEQNAIVEMKSEQWRQIAIETLDGEPYGYRILKVEKARPRKPRF